MEEIKRFLYVDDDHVFGEEVKGMLEKKGHVCDTTTSISTAKELLEKHSYKAVVSDSTLRRHDDGIEFLDFVRVNYPKTRLALVSSRVMTKAIIPNRSIDAFGADRADHTEDDRYYNRAAIVRRQITSVNELEYANAHPIQKENSGKWKEELVDFLLTGKKKSAGKHK